MMALVVFSRGHFLGGVRCFDRWLCSNVMLLTQRRRRSSSRLSRRRRQPFRVRHGISAGAIGVCVISRAAFAEVCDAGCCSPYHTRRRWLRAPRSLLGIGALITAMVAAMRAEATPRPCA